MSHPKYDEWVRDRGWVSAAVFYFKANTMTLEGRLAEFTGDLWLAAVLVALSREDDGRILNQNELRLAAEQCLLKNGDCFSRDRLYTNRSEHKKEIAHMNPLKQMRIKNVQCLNGIGFNLSNCDCPSHGVKSLKFDAYVQQPLRQGRLL